MEKPLPEPIPSAAGSRGGGAEQFRSLVDPDDVASIR